MGPLAALTSHPILQYIQTMMDCAEARSSLDTSETIRRNMALDIAKLEKSARQAHEASQSTDTFDGMLMKLADKAEIPKNKFAEARSPMMAGYLKELIANFDSVKLLDVNVKKNNLSYLEEYEAAARAEFAEKKSDQSFETSLKNLAIQTGCSDQLNKAGVKYYSLLEEKASWVAHTEKEAQERGR